MAVQVELEIKDINVILDGLALMAENADRIQVLLRQQAVPQMNKPEPKPAAAKSSKAPPSA